ncbi:glycosyltransferase family A protein [Pedobacter sp. L105]|uniref:glycosyltransferase family 2 protein n=1 Tax=Pedobacter sp. L105 TaxID=1641871 RepID=UPI00131CF9CE|nr:glycosyltransferase family A protein [Pedobacter sp. L105]
MGHKSHNSGSIFFNFIQKPIMMSKISLPLISCICITDNRPEFLKKAISCFYAQNYVNKELIISYPENDRISKQLVQDLLQRLVIKIVPIERPSDYSIGKAKNHAILNCNGDYICTWDDDDWYHSDRLMVQYHTMRGQESFKQASYLTHIFLYDTINQIGNYSFPHYWSGSLLCNKDIILQIPYTDSNVGEDLPILQFLTSKNLIHQQADVPFLYIYVYHGKNVLDHFHFQYFLKKSIPLDTNNSLLIAQQLA